MDTRRTTNGDNHFAISYSTPPTQQRAKWLWWIVGVAVTLLSTGFVASEYLTSFERKAHADQWRKTHTAEQKERENKLNKAMANTNERLDELERSVDRTNAATKLSNYKIEILLERTERLRRSASHRERELMHRAREQRAHLTELEAAK